MRFRRCRATGRGRRWGTGAPRRSRPAFLQASTSISVFSYGTQSSGTVCQTNTGGVFASICFSIETASSASGRPCGRRAAHRNCHGGRAGGRDHRVGEHQAVRAHRIRVVTMCRRARRRWRKSQDWRQGDRRRRSRSPRSRRHRNAIRRHAYESATSLQPLPSTRPGRWTVSRNSAARTR